MDLQYNKSLVSRTFREILETFLRGVGMGLGAMARVLGKRYYL